jgi:hypothetical protein
MEPNVTPQEQKQYDLVMRQARGILFGTEESDQSFRIVLEKLAQGSKDMGTTIGHTAAMVMLSVKRGIESKGRAIPGDVLFHAGDEVVDDLIEIAVAGKMMQESQAEEVKKQAVFEALRIAGQSEIDAGLTPEKQAAAKAEVQAVVARAQERAKSGAKFPPAGIIDSRRK